MINSLKTVGVFICGLDAEYRQQFCRNINLAAKELGYNVLYFNFLGDISPKVHDYGENEGKLLDIVPFEELDGIIVDEDGFTMTEITDRLYEGIESKAKCPVVVVNSTAGKHALHIDDAQGIKELVGHFVKVHGFERIGFMSGPFGRFDADERANAFKEAMKSYGLPEEGEGIFEGDFWFNKGDEAAKFFANREVRPQAVICASDFMAMSLCNGFRKLGLTVPDDICVSGFDGTEEGQGFVPGLTTIDRLDVEIPRRAIELIDDHYKGIKRESRSIVPKCILGESCGCCKIDYKNAVYQVNRINDIKRLNNYFIADTEAALLKMNAVQNIDMLSKTIELMATNFGGYKFFGMMAFVDDHGKTGYQTTLRRPTGRVLPAIWIDKTGKFKRPVGVMDTKELVPYCGSEEPQYLYVTLMHSGNHCFGYTIVSMTGEGPFNNYYKLWTVNISISLELLLRANNIDELIECLERAGIRDGLTGLLNRRGFESKSGEAYYSLEEGELASTIVVDMDGLKKINDIYGHTEGDYAIKAVADIISSCCRSCDIAGRTGGDEFYVFLPECDENRAQGIVNAINQSFSELNSSGRKPYKIDASVGVYTAPATKHSCVEDFVKISDERMYEIKRRRKSAV